MCASPITQDDVRLVSFKASLERDDGGGRRVRAFQRALNDCGIEVNEVGVGAGAISGSVSRNDSVIRQLKRRLLPVPLRFPISRELAAVEGSARAVSLCPGTHRWAIQNSAECWVDYPDLWSNYALNAIGEQRMISRGTCRAQAAVWRRRERLELEEASVVTVASWTDKTRLGAAAKWLPTPTHSRKAIPRRQQRRPDKLSLGMIANFYYPPNRRAFDDLIDIWLPQLAHLDAVIVIAGFGSESLPRVPGVEIIGEVRDVDEFYDQVDFALSPIFLGGGMKVKVVEAMAFGVPVVASNHSLDGLPPAIQQACLTLDGFLRDPLHRYDPRMRTDVADELDQFTIESFTTQVADLWCGRMTLSKGV
ncbi:MAG: glycosyltransferase [Hyphomicrobiales bacterium]|nr:MAG: glycosyltransferase [Hyphomicrobiales bacterium]